MKIERYEPSKRGEWDAFVRESKNGTFLFERDYMDYHSDRFHDHSLMIYDDKGRLVSVLPAHEDGARYASHDGLTYGGFVTHYTMGSGTMLDMLGEVKEYLRAAGFEQWLYKTIPHIYQTMPAEEDLYALWWHGANVTRSGVIAALPLMGRRPPQQTRRERALKAVWQAGVTVVRNIDLAEFWRLLSDTLLTRHGAHPVHSLAEIELLRSRFPANIKLIGARQDGKLLAGAVMYETPQVARIQYMAASPEGREAHALDLIIDALRNGSYFGKQWLDMGTSDERGGRWLNRGLIDYKESWGARAIAHNHYLLELGGASEDRHSERYAAAY